MKKGEIRNIQRRLERIESELVPIRAFLSDYGLEPQKKITDANVPESGTQEPEQAQKKESNLLRKNRGMEAGIRP